MDPEPEAALAIIRVGELPSQKNDYPDKVATEKEEIISYKWLLPKYKRLKMEGGNYKRKSAIEREITTYKRKFL